jgi:hypothetical protein
MNNATLAYPQLKLPNSAEQIAFRTVDQMLRSDPVLSTTVKAWRSWRGEANDILDPTFATCPYVRISPVPEVSLRQTETQHKMPLDVRIQAAVGGSDFDQLTNFWGAIRTALYPTNPARRTAILNMANAAYITRSQMTLNGYGVRVEESGLRMMIAQGTLQLILLVMTM